jgi:hypothetical protein
MSKLEPIVNGIVIAAMMYGIYGVIKLLIVAYKFF